MGNTQTAEEVIYGYWREDKPARPGHSRELIPRWSKDPEHLQEPVFEGCRTIWEIFQRIVKEKPENRFLGTRNASVEGRPYEWKTFREVYDLVDLFARGVQALGLAPDTEGEGQIWNFLGIFSKNREEWAIADLACARSSVTIVPFYDSLGPEALSMVINQTELTTMCIEKASLDNLIKLKETKCHSLKHIVLFDGATEEDKAKASAVGLRVHSFGDVLQSGRENPQVVLKEPKPESIYMFCYTSGTTGDAKGAKETHSAFIADMYFFDNGGFAFTEADIHISYLPYAHVYEQCCFVKSICVGFSIGYYSGDALRLLEDVQVLKPTVFFTVPRILNRIHSKILDGVNQTSGFKQWLFNKAIREKQEAFLESGTLEHKVYDLTVLKKIRDILGGHVRLMATGAAPINSEVLSFLQVAFSATVHEGYGQTEALVCTVTDKRDTKSAGTVGGPAPSIKFRLRDIPEMNYLASDVPNPRGELQFFGRTMFKGYYKNSERTAEAFSDDGWINSGDVAVILPNGNVKIIDRAKNIFKLAQGEYVAPEKLENIYVQCSLIAQIFVHGDSVQNFLVAIVVPDPEVFPKFVAAHPVLSTVDKKDLLNHDLTKKAILAEMDAKAKEYNLSGIEKVKKIHVNSQGFTVQNDLVTPTFKLKRFNAKQHFLEQIAEMYAEGI